MNSNKKYHAFISYSHKDKPYASAIQKSIETLGVPFYKRWQPDVNVFRDERKIPLAGNLTEQIIIGLKESEYLIVIASKNSANSNWVREEIHKWHNLNKDENGFITNFNFILTDDVIEWDYLNHDFNKLTTTALPSFDKKIFKELPLWANLQHYCKNGNVQSNNSNYEWEIAKIKGLLLCKKPDEIIDEVSKGKRIFRSIVGVVIFLLVGLSGLAFYGQQKAEQNANEAKFQRDYSRKKEKEAQEQRDEAINNLRQFKVEEFNRNLKNGNTFFAAEGYYFADSLFSLANETARDKNFRPFISKSAIRYLDSISVICKNKYSFQ